MVSAPFGNIDLKPAYEYLKLLDIPQIFYLETGKHHLNSQRAFYQHKSEIISTTLLIFRFSIHMA